MVPICTEWWCTEANEATQTHCYNPVAPAYPIWAYYAHGRQRRCQEDPVSLPSGRLEKATRLSPHHVAQHCPTGSETTPPYTLRSSRFGSEPPSVEDDVDIWRYAIVSCMPEMTTYGLTGMWRHCVLDLSVCWFIHLSGTKFVNTIFWKWKCLFFMPVGRSSPRARAKPVNFKGQEFKIKVTWSQR